MVKIIVDSAQDFTKEEALKYDIEIVPMTIMFSEQEQYLDGKTITFDEYYDKLESCDDLPKTSQVTPGEWINAIEKFPEADDIILFTMSSLLSGTYNAACIAANNYSNVKVFDTYNVTAGAKIQVLRAIDLLNEGKSVEETLNILEKEKVNVRLVALLDTLRYLRKGGRINPAIAIIGDIFSIKPMIEIAEGKVRFLGKARGRKVGRSKLTELIEGYNGIDFSKPCAVCYTGKCRDLLDKYLEEYKDLYDGHNVPINRVGATIGTHIGPDAICVVFYANVNKEETK